MNWVSSDPEVSKRLRAIDRAHERNRAKAARWTLAEKLRWYHKCDEQKSAAYARVMGAAYA